MTINIQTGSTVEFAVAFFSSVNVLIVPSSATITVNYPPSSNYLTTVSCSIGMTPSGQYWIASWGSGVAALGLSSYSVVSSCQVTPTTGTLRITN